MTLQKLLALADRLESLNLKVYETTSGRETFQLLERHSPDILLLDIAIPDSNGLDILKEIRRHGIRVTVIMLTASRNATCEVTRKVLNCSITFISPKKPS